MGQIQSAINQAIGSTGQIVAFGLGPKAGEVKQTEAEIKEREKKLATATENYKKIEGEIGKLKSNEDMKMKEPLYRKRMEAMGELFDLDPSKENAMLLAQARTKHEEATDYLKKKVEQKNAKIKELRKEEKQKTKALAKANAEIEMKTNQITEMYENAKITQEGGSN